MKIAEIENHLRANLPVAYPQFTDDWNAISSASVTSNLMTLTTSNSLDAGDLVLINGIIYHNPITGVILNNQANKAIVQCDHVTEFSEGFSSELIISGANEPEWNGTFSIVSVPSRYEVEIEITPSMTTVPTGSPVVEEINLPRYNSVFSVQSATSTEFTVNTINATDGVLFGSPEFIELNKVCVASDVDIDRVLQSYTRQEIDKVWLFPIAGATASSRDRDQNTDFEQTFKSGNKRIFHTQENLSIFAFFPTQNNVTAVNAQDTARNELKAALLSILVGYRPSSPVTDKMDLMYYVADGIETYNKSFYVHRYDFAVNVDITPNDTYVADSYVTRRIEVDYINDENRQIIAEDVLDYTQPDPT